MEGWRYWAGLALTLAPMFLIYALLMVDGISITDFIAYCIIVALLHVSMDNYVDNIKKFLQ